MNPAAAKLQTWQAVLGLAAAVLGLFVYTRKPASAAPAEGQLAAPVGPAGFGEVGGGGGGGSSASTPAPTRGGEQTKTAGNPSAGSSAPPMIFPAGKLVNGAPRPAAPGESQHEYEERRRSHVSPGLAPRKATA